MKKGNKIFLGLALSFFVMYGLNLIFAYQGNIKTPDTFLFLTGMVILIGIPYIIYNLVLKYRKQKSFKQIKLS